MDEDGDLDAELALFESQIQRVKEAAKPSDPSKTPTSTPATKPAPQLPKTEQTQPKPRTRQLHEKSAPASKTAQEKAQPAGRWHWDGTTWRWRTTAAAPATSAPMEHTPTSQTPLVSVPKKPLSVKRTAAGEVWQDPTLADWPEDDHRIFVGDLAPDATEKHLSDAFGVYPSFARARVVRDKRSGACRGYGFVSFSDGRDMVRALRELNGKYVGGRPVKLKRSNWQKRSLTGEKWKELKALRKIAKR